MSIWQQKEKKVVESIIRRRPEAVRRLLEFKDRPVQIGEIIEALRRENPRLVIGLKPSIIRAIFNLHGGRPKKVILDLKADTRRRARIASQQQRQEVRHVLPDTTKLGADFDGIREKAKDLPTEELLSRVQKLQRKIADIRAAKGKHAPEANQPQIELNAIKRVLKDNGIKLE